MNITFDLVFGLICLFTGIGVECFLIWNLYVINSCTEQVEGTLVEVEAINRRLKGGRYYWSYRPTYRYKFKHCWYTSKAMLDFLLYSEEKQYKKGHKYNIYINPKTPKNCITSRYRIESVIYLILYFIGGIVLLSVGILKLWLAFK